MAKHDEVWALFTPERALRECKKYTLDHKRPPAGLIKAAGPEGKALVNAVNAEIKSWGTPGYTKMKAYREEPEEREQD